MSKRVWLFSRLSTFTGSDGLKRVMDNCRNKALEKGYTVVDETVVIGSSDLAMAAVTDIINHNDIENGAECIFSVNGNSLSRDLITAMNIYKYITAHGMKFETSADDTMLLDEHNPVGAVFALIAKGEKQLPDNFEFEDQENPIDDDEDPIFEPMGQTM